MEKTDEVLEPEYTLNLDEIPKVGNNGHNWVTRGIVITCDGAGSHPPHRHAIR